MRSSFKNTMIAVCSIVFLLGGSTNVNATASAVQKKKHPYNEEIYPTYPATTPGATPEENALIQRGEYLSKMGDCISCHTNVVEGGAPYSGGLPIHTPFGIFYTPNITPDQETGIGSWSEEDFIRALKQGKDPHGKNYFPVFPYIYFSQITDEDAKALFSYFRSIPAVNLKNKSLPFPFNVPGARLTLWGWNFLFFFANQHEFTNQDNQSALWNRGRYIVDSLGHCSMCHTPLNPFGAPKTDYYLSGGFIDGYWAPNISKIGLESASVEEVVNVFSKGELINGAGPVAGPMAEVNHNSLKYLTAEDQTAIATYLKSVESNDPLGLPPSNNKPTLARGKQVYMSSCTICHQDGQMSAPLNGDGANWYRRLKNSGLTGLYQHVINGYNSMPVKGACVTCSENDIIAATDYILNNSLSRSQWINVSSKGSAEFPMTGEAVYQQNCGVCHNEGKNNAPKLGDKAEWQPVVKKNMDIIIKNTLNSSAHPQNGGCKRCSTEEVIEAIKYMVSQSMPESNYSLW